MLAARIRSQCPCRQRWFRCFALWTIPGTAANPPLFQQIGSKKFNTYPVSPLVAAKSRCATTAFITDYLPPAAGQRSLLERAARVASDLRRLISSNPNSQGNLGLQALTGPGSNPLRCCPIPTLLRSGSLYTGCTPKHSYEKPMLVRIGGGIICPKVAWVGYARKVIQECKAQ